MVPLSGDLPRQAQKGIRCVSGTVPAAVSSANSPESDAIEKTALRGAFPRRPGLGEVRRPAIVKFGIRARGQVRAET